MSTQEQQYIKGFNHGYLLTKHLPDLVAKLVKQLQATTNDYLSGFFSGKEEYELEASRNELNMLGNIRKGANNKDLEQDR